MPVRFEVLKPDFVTRISYCPGGSDGNEYRPSSLVTVLRVTLVSALMRVTSADGTEAPCASRTSPERPPNVCPWIAAAKHRIDRTLNDKVRMLLPDYL